MPRIQIYVADHRDISLAQPRGKIIAPWRVLSSDLPGPAYADFCALYGAWRYFSDGYEPEIIGFFGYRKYLDLDRVSFNSVRPAHAPDWFQCSKEDFDSHREFMANWDGAAIKRSLAEYDILQAAPFPVEDVVADFADSRSLEDARRLGDATGWEPLDKIYPYLFVTRWSVFDRMMREMEPIRLKLHGSCRGEDSTDEEYKKRPMAYIMERVYSHWLENADLSVHLVPLLHCWEMS